MALVGVLCPTLMTSTSTCKQFLMELVSRHEGRLTAEIFKGLRKLAQRINAERIAQEREFKRITKQ